MRLRYIGIIALLASLVLIAACATQPATAAFDPPGFWSGLIHGAISPFALIGAFFTEARIYAFPNSGWWYDLGFLLGIGATWGGGTAYAL